MALASLLFVTIGSLWAWAPASAQDRALVMPDSRWGGSAPNIRINGRGLAVKSAAPDIAANLAAAPAMASSDTFGYTWSGWPPNWIDARDGGIEVGWTGDQATAVGPLPLPFPFKYYEYTYNSFWIASGYITFQDSPNWDTQPDIPSPAQPNTIVAPYATPLGIELPNAKHRMYYKSGGSAPNRFLAVEWYKVQQGNDGAVSDFTFEVVLYESGNIMFQYADMNYTGTSYYCGSSGIEDSTGLDGMLVENDYCDQIASDHGVYITRPAPSARVRVAPRSLGRFTQANTQEVFNFSVRNTGDLGTDTYNLSVASAWPATLYSAIGAPLVDTNQDGLPDTGPIAQGSQRTFRVAVASPAYVNLGVNNFATVTAQSARNGAKQGSVRVATTFAAPFAQAYTDQGDNSGDVRMDLVDPGLTRSKAIVTSGALATFPSIVALPGGGYLQMWYLYRSNGAGDYYKELYRAVLDANGVTVHPARLLMQTPLSGNARVWDQNFVVEVAPDGHVVIGWVRWQYRADNDTQNANVYYMVLDQTGAVSRTPTVLTNNTAWYKWGVDGYVGSDVPALAATADNHFLLAWEREEIQGGTWRENIDYAVLNNIGTLLKGPVPFSDAYSKDNATDPALVTLADGRVLLVYNGTHGMSRAVLDSAGTVVQGEVQLGSNWIWQPRSPVAEWAHAPGVGCAQRRACALSALYDALGERVVRNTYRANDLCTASNLVG
ncbi:MAG: hypothetical protein IPK16_00265 [Anaerolineales bacterium]|nr:hypothetical protein [Anaerolineales bacterium]